MNTGIGMSLWDLFAAAKEAQLNCGDDELPEATLKFIEAFESDMSAATNGWYSYSASNEKSMKHAAI